MSQNDITCDRKFTTFCRYNTVQVFASKLLGPLGAASVAVFYAVCMCMCTCVHVRACHAVHVTSFRPCHAMPCQVSVFTGGDLPPFLASKFGARC